MARRCSGGIYSGVCRSEDSPSHCDKAKYSHFACRMGDSLPQRVRVRHVTTCLESSCFVPQATKGSNKADMSDMSAPSQIGGGTVPSQLEDHASLQKN
ncbi:hypothetical protein BO82DRAFT_195772 [Aspergillus uvarum CBS 121591]|uniref:Uncharacterized protein n=1 Tax=Aspergillus uvarum CBS 121591 TaxID=1448315 RepID=A0A319BWT1_9EURO|nr:hypothetical protein BO82DRAFT_195772 [Aspergillus uvarum CBS 121591]PYH76721.1 hypothetical protein BO82DRAFT_195772 [Aspergillus uvarum CBS 121591]